MSGWLSMTTSWYMLTFNVPSTVVQHHGDSCLWQIYDDGFASAASHCDVNWLPMCLRSIQELALMQVRATNWEFNQAS